MSTSERSTLPSGRQAPASVAELRASYAPLATARAALLDEGRKLTLAELEDLARVPEDAVPALAALAHEVRLAWCGPTVEVEGIISAKTGGCPEDCHFCSQSAAVRLAGQGRRRSSTLDEVLAAARETAALGATEFCIVVAVRGPDERTDRPHLEASCRWSATRPA